MKKILLFIFLGLLTVNSNLFSTNEQNNQLTPKKLSNLDKAKVTAATIGCLLCSLAALTAYDTTDQIRLVGCQGLSLINLPAYLISLPFTIYLDQFIKAKNWNETLDFQELELLGDKIFKERMVYNICGTATSIIPTILAILLGRYVYTKLSQSNSDKKQTIEL